MGAQEMRGARLNKLFVGLLISSVVGSLSANVNLGIDIAPASGSLSGGTVLALSGSAFYEVDSSNQSSVAVDIGGIPCDVLFRPSAVSNSSLACVTRLYPNAQEGLDSPPLVVTVTLSNNQYQLNTSFTYSWNSTPQIHYLDPSSIPVGHMLGFTGINLPTDPGDIEAVFIGDQPCDLVNATSNEPYETYTREHTDPFLWMRCLPRQVTPGVYNVSVVVGNRMGRAWRHSNSKYYGPGGRLIMLEVFPDIQSVQPSASHPLGGELITITGAGLSCDMAVDIDGIPCKVIHSSFSEVKCLTGAAPAGHAAVSEDGTYPSVQEGYRFKGGRGVSSRVFLDIGRSTHINRLYGASKFPDNPDYYFIYPSYQPEHARRYDSSGELSQAFFIPQETTTYVLWLQADNEGELFFGTNANISNVTRIGYVPNHNGYPFGTKLVEGAYLKHDSQRAEPMVLVAGESYLILGAAKEGRGRDYIRALALLPNSTYAKNESGWVIQDEPGWPNGYFMRPLPGFMLQTVEETPQVHLRVNGLLASCLEGYPLFFENPSPYNGCSFVYRHSRPRITRACPNTWELSWNASILRNISFVNYTIVLEAEGSEGTLNMTGRSDEQAEGLTVTIPVSLETEYTATITGVMANGTSVSDSVAFYTESCDLPQPTDGGVSVVALNEAGKVRVTWSRPTLGRGQVITGYSVQYRRRGTPSYTTHFVSGSSATSYTITSLNLGTEYEVRVASVGPLGLSGYCCGNGKRVTTYNRPHPPSAVTAVPGASLGSIRVTWVAPSDTGGVPIAAYFIQYRIWGSAYYATQSSQPQPTEATIAGLRLGTIYQIRLATVTAIGIGPYCCTQNGSEVLARTHDVPAKMSGVSAVPGVISGRPTIQITWSPPQSDKPIAKYYLQYRKASASNWTAVTLDSSETSAVLSGLDRGTLYDVQVRAISIVGSGPFSDLQQVTTHNVPSLVSPPSVSPTESARHPALSVSWSPPQSDLPIQYYTISYLLTDSGPVTNITTTSISLLIANLKIGATYQVAVSARSALGEGPRSVWVHQTTHSLPGQVTRVTLSREVRSGAPALRVTWTAPQSDMAITHYHARHRKSSIKSWTTSTVSGSPPSTVTYLEGLSLGVTYEVQLQAESAIGLGTFSEVQTATAYDVPTPVPQASFMVTPTVIGGRSSLSVQWRPPSSDLPVLRYTVTVKVSPSVGGKGRKETTNSTSLTVENLTIGTTYTVSVKARSAVGFGAELQRRVNTLDVLPPDGVSSYPLPQPGTVQVAWTQAPNSTHGLTLMGYSVQYRVEGGDRYQSQQVAGRPSLGELETFELEGLELGTTYEIRVAMVTTSGVGKYSDVINVTTYADCCSKCSSIQSTVFVSFEVDEMKVNESDTLVHIDVHRYGPMSAPITLRVTDIPLTAKRGQDYSLQSSSLVFLNTERMVERSTVVVRIREDSTPEQDPPTESFRLVLSSNAGGGMQPAVVFSVPEMEVHIKDNDY